jgi:hypothetical protein
LHYDGGLTVETTTLYLVWEDYINRGKTDSAAWYASHAFPANTNLSAWRTDTAHGYRIRFNDTLIAAMDSLPLDGVNMHFYYAMQGEDTTEPFIDKEMFKATVRWLHRVTGKPVITNEFGIWNNTNATIMSQMLDAVEELHDAKNGDMSHALWYAGNPNYAIANSNGSLTPLGEALKTKIQEQHIDAGGNQ